MNVDWDLLSKWDVIFGILGGIVLLFTAIRWTVRRASSSQVAKLVAWSVIGEENEQALALTIRNLAKLLFAALVWAAIGAALAVFAVAILVAVDLALDVHVNGIAEGILQGAVFGAVAGASFRGVIWPIWSTIRMNRQRRKSANDLRYDEFVKQRQRVESEIKRARDND